MNFQYIIIFKDDYMSNIIKNNDTLLMLTDDIKYLKKHNISKYFIEELLKQMIPTNNMKQLINCFIIESNFKDGSVAFDPFEKKLKYTQAKLNYWLENSISILINDYHIKDIDTLKAYQLIQIIAHEIEHAYQYLMGINVIDAPNSIIAKAYKDIYALLTKDSEDKAKKIYFANFKKLLLERNAQIESFDLILKCSKHDGKLDIYDAYKSLFNTWASIGYKDNSYGSIHETYQILKLCDKNLNFNSVLYLSQEEKMRYGLPVSDATRQKILKKLVH